MKKSWKTTAIGAVLAGLTVLQAYLEQGGVKPSTIAVAVAIAVLGVLAKDYDVSGE